MRAIAGKPDEIEETAVPGRRLQGDASPGSPPAALLGLGVCPKPLEFAELICSEVVASFLPRRYGCMIQPNAKPPEIPEEADPATRKHRPRALDSRGKPAGARAFEPEFASSLIATRNGLAPPPQQARPPSAKALFALNRPTI